jgi:hypothetical protein
VGRFSRGLSPLEIIKQLFSSDFLPHGTCYLWDSKIVWLHVISDGVITLSYYCIPLALIYLVRKRRDIPFNWIFWMFGLFILGCGTTHLMEVWTVWHPTYLLSGIIKAITAAVSIATAIVLLQLLPKAIALPSVDQLYGLNRELERQADTRARREQELTRVIEELELQVNKRTAELESINDSLEREIAFKPRGSALVPNPITPMLSRALVPTYGYRQLLYLRHLSTTSLVGKRAERSNNPF